MKGSTEKAESFVTAFNALSTSERKAVLERLFAHPMFKEDLCDIALWFQRREERAIPYEQIRTSLKRTHLL